MIELLKIFLLFAPVQCLTHSACRQDGDLLPDEQDCSKFYKCQGGIPVSLSCPVGLRFNQKIQVCDWPDAVASCPVGRLSSILPAKASLVYSYRDEDDGDLNTQHTEIRFDPSSNSSPVSSLNIIGSSVSGSTVAAKDLTAFNLLSGEIPSTLPSNSRAPSQKISQLVGSPAKSILVKEYSISSFHEGGFVSSSEKSEAVGEKSKSAEEKSMSTRKCPDLLTINYCSLCCSPQVFDEVKRYEFALQHCHHVNHPEHCNACCPGLNY